MTDIAIVVDKYVYVFVFSSPSEEPKRLSGDSLEPPMMRVCIYVHQKRREIVEVRLTLYRTPNERTTTNFSRLNMLSDNGCVIHKHLVLAPGTVYTASASVLLYSGRAIILGEGPVLEPVDSVELSFTRRTTISPNVVVEAHLSTQRRERGRNTDQR